MGTVQKEAGQTETAKAGTARLETARATFVSDFDVGVSGFLTS